MSSSIDAQRDAQRDDRKSAALAAQHVKPRKGTREVGSYALARDILRSTSVRQAGLGDTVGSVTLEPEFASVFFLDGEDHKRKRAAIARYFTPKAIDTRHRAVMESVTTQLLTRLRQAGRGELDKISFELAVAVAAEIVGLTETDKAAMAKRIRATLIGVHLPTMGRFKRPFGQALAAVHGMRFFTRDVRPAIKARRVAPREDIISHLLEQGYPDKAILIECMTYAVAGMVTTREFIVMSAWHMLDNPELRVRFLASEPSDQTTILEELLRLEPVAALLYREGVEDAELSGGSVQSGETVALNLREANVDEASVGACPFQIDPDRGERMKITGAFLSFGDGTHRCPGANVALEETRVFLDRLLRVPGLRLEGEPEMTWNDSLESYELRHAWIACDRG